MGLLPMKHSKEGGPSQCASVFHILVIKMYSLPVIPVRLKNKVVVLEKFGGREEEKELFVGRAEMQAISLSLFDHMLSLGIVNRYLSHGEGWANSLSGRWSTL